MVFQWMPWLVSLFLSANITSLTHSSCAPTAIWSGDIDLLAFAPAGWQAAYD
jgi:hypothetical protein